MCTIMQAKYDAGFNDGKIQGETRGEARGKLNTIISLVRKNLLDKEIGASQLDLSIEEFEKLLNSVQI